MSTAKPPFSSRPALASATPSFIAGHATEELEQEICGKIRDRAYLLFEQSGREPGNEDANWLRAESEIVRSGAQVRESGSWVTFTASIPDGSGLGMQIVVRPSRILVRTMQARNGQDPAELAKRGEREIFLGASLPVEVDPASATASFRNHNLHLMAKKRQPGQAKGS